MTTISALYAGVSAETYDSARGSPVTPFGNDGYVYNSHHDMLWTYGQTKFGDAVTIFKRNVDFLLNHIKEVQQQDILKSRSGVYALVTECMTALEKLVSDVFTVCYQECGHKNRPPSLSRFFAWQEIFRKNFNAAFEHQFVDNAHFEALKYLAAFRNCIVHQAGIIDQKTLEEIRNHPNLGLFRERGPLPMDLQTVISLTDSVTQWCGSLIKLADKFLES